MIKDFIDKHWKRNRLLLGDDSLMTLYGINYDSDDKLKLESYHSGRRVMTWRVPEEWAVKEAYIEDEQGNRYLDYKDNPLHLVAYSTPIDKWVSWDELASHIRVSEKGIPWEFKYYERDWGFCCTGTDLWQKRVDRKGKFHVVIDAEYKQGTMLVGELQLGNIGVSDLVIMSHYDHPHQANDGLSGVAVALEVYERLKAHPPEWFSGVRFLFVPETIGSIAYFSNHDYSKMTGGIFLDVCGNWTRTINCQQSSYWGNIDDITEDVLNDYLSKRIDTSTGYMVNRTDYFNRVERGDIPGNDEIVLNSLGILCVALNRFPYPEYHTSADTIDIIYEDKLQEIADVTEEIIRRYCTNYKPKPTYEGIPSL